MIVLVAVVLLAAGIAGGYALWVRPLSERLDRRSHALLLFVLLSLAGAFWGALPWWFDTESTFSWDLPPLASRMLGAAALAFVTAAVFALARPARELLRLMLIMVAVYLLPLTLAILAFHLDGFDFSRPVVIGFFAVVALMCSASVYFLAFQPGAPVPGPDRASPPPALAGAWLAAVGVVTLLWGLALFVTDNGFSREIWAWPGDLLSTRLIGVMLLTLAAVAFYALLRPAVVTMALAVISTYGVAGAFANIWQDFLDKPVKQDYVVALGVIGVGSLAFLSWRLASPAPAGQPETATSP
jgi:hypothetical protein